MAWVVAGVAVHWVRCTTNRRYGKRRRIHRTTAARKSWGLTQKPSGNGLTGSFKVGNDFLGNTVTYWDSGGKFPSFLCHLSEKIIPVVPGRFLEFSAIFKGVICLLYHSYVFRVVNHVAMFHCAKFSQINVCPIFWRIAPFLFFQLSIWEEHDWLPTEHLSPNAS